MFLTMLFREALRGKLADIFRHSTLLSKKLDAFLQSSIIIHMSEKICPECEMNDVLEHVEKWECMTCGHEWPREAEHEKAQIIKDANGNCALHYCMVIFDKDI